LRIASLLIEGPYMAKCLKELQGMCPRSGGPNRSEQAQKRTATY